MKRFQLLKLNLAERGIDRPRDRGGVPLFRDRRQVVLAVKPSLKPFPDPDLRRIRQGSPVGFIEQLGELRLGVFSAAGDSDKGRRTAGRLWVPDPGAKCSSA